MIALFLTTDRLKSVKATWDQAPEGPKKAAALAYYQVAERAHIAQRDGDCVRALDAVVIALR
jgi:uncharacterized protein YecT (DUF1311 family)